MERGGGGGGWWGGGGGGGGGGGVGGGGGGGGVGWLMGRNVLRRKIWSEIGVALAQGQGKNKRG